MVRVVERFEIGQLRGRGHPCTTADMIGAPVGASTRPRSWVMATVISPLPTSYPTGPVGPVVRAHPV